MTAHPASLFLAAALVLSGTVANAACYADYKAKRDDPLRLHYGVVALSAECTPQAAEAYISPLLLADGWQLLEIVGTFDEDGLAEREEDAGEFFLRY